MTTFIIGLVIGLIVGRILPRRYSYNFAELCGEMPLHPSSRFFHGGELDPGDKRYQRQQEVYNRFFKKHSIPAHMGVGVKVWQTMQNIWKGER